MLLCLVPILAVGGWYFYRTFDDEIDRAESDRGLRLVLCILCISGIFAIFNHYSNL